jgi:ATP-dependent protease HslVU (ClpYQ) peptidase subunit
MADEVQDVQNVLNKKVIAGASGGLIGIASLFITYIDSKLEASTLLVEEKYKNMKIYVDAKHEIVETKLDKIEHLLIKIDDRIYEIIKHSKGG